MDLFSYCLNWWLTRTRLGSPQWCLSLVYIGTFSNLFTIYFNLEHFVFKWFASVSDILHLIVDLPSHFIDTCSWVTDSHDERFFNYFGNDIDSLFFPRGGGGKWTWALHILGKYSATWIVHTVLLFVFCFWDTFFPNFAHSGLKLSIFLPLPTKYLV
jgi:hypothetical protein